MVGQVITKYSKASVLGQSDLETLEIKNSFRSSGKDTPMATSTVFSSPYPQAVQQLSKKHYFRETFKLPIVEKQEKSHFANFSKIKRSTSIEKSTI